MSGISVQDLLTPQTAAQVRTTMVGALVTMGIPADQWNPGGPLSVILTVLATLYANLTVLMAQAIGSGFLPTASGGWLTLLAFYVYGVTRPPGTFAAGKITLTNSQGGTFSRSPGQVTFLDTTNGQTYRNTDPISLGAVGSPTATQTVGIQCTAIGAIGSAAPNEITSLVTSMQGVTVTNALAVVGQDAMADAPLRTLCTNKLGSLSVRGPRSAYAFAIAVAVSPTTGGPVNVNRYSISRSSHTGTVTIVVASAEGAPTGDDINGVIDSIESGVPGLSPPFSGARPDCVTVFVSGATTVAYSPSITLWALSTPGVSATAIEYAAAAALLTYLEGYPIGGVPTDQGQGLWASGVEGAITEGAPAPIVAIEGTTDLALAAGQVPTDGITLAVRLVTLT